MDQITIDECWARIKKIRKTLENEEESITRERKSSGLHSVGMNFLKMEVYPSAIEQFQLAMELSFNSKRRAELYGALGLAYEGMDRYVDQVENYTKGLFLARTLDDSTLKSELERRLGEDKPRIRGDDQTRFMPQALSSIEDEITKFVLQIDPNIYEIVRALERGEEEVYGNINVGTVTFKDGRGTKYDYQVVVRSPEGNDLKLGFDKYGKSNSDFEPDGVHQEFQRVIGDQLFKTQRNYFLADLYKVGTPQVKRKEQEAVVEK
jgi:tetratricopeptide (TPR) repeat protein